MIGGALISGLISVEMTALACREIEAGARLAGEIGAPNAVWVLRERVAKLGARATDDAALRTLRTSWELTAAMLTVGFDLADIRASGKMIERVGRGVAAGDWEVRVVDDDELGTRVVEIV